MSRVLYNFGIKLKKDVQASLAKKEREKAAKYGRSANGNSKLWGTVKVVFDETDPTSVELRIEDYWKWVDKGRKPGPVSIGGQSKIQDWIKRKGVNPSKIIDDMRLKYALKHHIKPPTNRTPFAQAQKQFGFIVSRKLKMKGYEGNDFLTEVLKDGRLEKLRADLKEEFKQDILTTIRIGNKTDK